MRLPRVRFTVRRMMLAVAIVAVALGTQGGISVSEGYRCQGRDIRVSAFFARDIRVRRDIGVKERSGCQRGVSVSEGYRCQRDIGV